MTFLAFLAVGAYGPGGGFAAHDDAWVDYALAAFIALECVLFMEGIGA